MTEPVLLVVGFLLAVGSALVAPVAVIWAADVAGRATQWW